MKALIWIGCIFLYAVISLLCQRLGIILGGIPTAILFVATIALARFLCKEHDKRKEEKKKRE